MDMSHGDGALYWTSQEIGQENKSLWKTLS